jgi:hypothetical protein
VVGFSYLQAESYLQKKKEPAFSDPGSSGDNSLHRWQVPGCIPAEPDINQTVMQT